MTKKGSGHPGASVVLLLPLSVAAQETPKIEVFGDCSYLRPTEQPRILTRRIGLLPDFSGHYGQRGLTPYTISSLTTSGQLMRVEAIPGDMHQHNFCWDRKCGC